MSRSWGDAGVVSAANKEASETARLSFITARSTPISHASYRTGEGPSRRHIPDGDVFTQPWPAGPTDKRRDEQVAKVEKAVAGKVPVKRNRIIKLTGTGKSVNGPWKPKHMVWPGSRATSPTSTTRHRSL
jgi:hypothetical protein